MKRGEQRQKARFHLAKAHAMMSPRRYFVAIPQRHGRKTSPNRIQRTTKQEQLTSRRPVCHLVCVYDLPFIWNTSCAVLNWTPEQDLVLCSFDKMRLKLNTAKECTRKRRCFGRLSKENRCKFLNARAGLSDRLTGTTDC
jgi:hypothetical protein